MEKINKIKVLVVEDDEDFLWIITQGLTKEKFLVVSALNGLEGLEMAETEKPDIILLDIMMPVMDGLTMLQKLRQKNDYGKKVPVILLTNLSADSEEIIKKIAETEPAYYIVKVNFSTKQVVDKIRELVR